MYNSKPSDQTTSIPYSLNFIHVK